jgi:hypothetical protein
MIELDDRFLERLPAELSAARSNASASRGRLRPSRT